MRERDIHTEHKRDSEQAGDACGGQPAASQPMEYGEDEPEIYDAKDRHRGADGKDFAYFDQPAEDIEVGQNQGGERREADRDAASAGECERDERKPCQNCAVEHDQRPCAGAVQRDVTDHACDDSDKKCCTKDYRDNFI